MLSESTTYRVMLLSETISSRLELQVQVQLQGTVKVQLHVYGILGFCDVLGENMQSRLFLEY